MVSLLSGIIQTLWIPGLLSSLRRVWFVIAVARILIFTIPTPSIPWKILSICAQSALPAVRLLGNYNGSFQDDCSLDDGVDDPEKLDELIHRTPGYSGWQQEYWRAHCGDYCAYLGNVGASELRALDVLEEVLDDPMWDR